MWTMSGRTMCHLQGLRAAESESRRSAGNVQPELADRLLFPLPHNSYWMLSHLLALKSRSAGQGQEDEMQVTFWLSVCPALMTRRPPALDRFTALLVAMTSTKMPSLHSVSPRSGASAATPCPIILYHVISIQRRTFQHSDHFLISP